MIHFHTLKIADYRRETEDCVSIALAIPDELTTHFQFQQGQNLTLKAIINGEAVRRSYSICSSPLDGELRVAIKKVPNGLFSSFANDVLKKGDYLEVMPPTGKFNTLLDAGNSKKYLAFAAGSGITPIISIIKTTLAKEPNSSFTLIYGNKNRSSIIFKEQLEALKNKYMQRFNLVHVLSRERLDTAIHYGRIDTEKCEAIHQQLWNMKHADEVFVCGPETMIHAVREFMERLGIAKKHIHFELFASPGQQQKKQQLQTVADNAPQSSITIRLDGLSFDFDLPYEGESILDGALRNGADLPYACKGGVCCTCRAKVVEGTVKMDVNYALEEEEIKAGFILCCQAHPTTEKVVVDYDQK
jgi:ring-1,2-phenylacetyl-CoA epoxidase subunit PaaE